MYCSSEIYNSKSLTNFIGLLKLAHQAGEGWRYSSKLDPGDLKRYPKKTGGIIKR